MTTDPVTDNNNVNKEIIQWACESLSSHGYILKSNLPETVQKTPWSYVVRFATTDGYIYLKHMPKMIALEAVIIQILRDQFHASVPEVIAHNDELNCFLMKDAGTSLRVILKKQFDEALLCKAIEQFTLLQLAVADQIDVFLAIGVPDWRLDKLPDLFKEIILQKDFLIKDGLSEMEMSELEKLLPTISDLCKKLSDYSIKQTIVQPDFNDNNTLVNDISQAITIIDVGELSITHPFFSPLNMLQQLRKHHALTENDATYLRIKEVCFKNFMTLESKKDLSDAVAIAETLWPVYGVLAHYRLMMACGKEKILSLLPGRLSGSLKELLLAL